MLALLFASPGGNGAQLGKHFDMVAAVTEYLLIAELPSTFLGLEVMPADVGDPRVVQAHPVDADRLHHHVALPPGVEVCSERRFRRIAAPITRPAQPVQHDLTDGRDLLAAALDPGLDAKAAVRSLGEDLIGKISVLEEVFARELNIREWFFLAVDVDHLALEHGIVRWAAHAVEHVGRFVIKLHPCDRGVGFGYSQGHFALTRRAVLARLTGGSDPEGVDPELPAALDGQGVEASGRIGIELDCDSPPLRFPLQTHRLTIDIFFAGAKQEMPVAGTADGQAHLVFDQWIDGPKQLTMERPVPTPRSRAPAPRWGP